jgi:hypothetical protein
VKYALYTALLAVLVVLIAVCWLIGRCVQWMRLGYWRHEA